MHTAVSEAPVLKSIPSLHFLAIPPALPPPFLSLGRKKRLEKKKVLSKSRNKESSSLSTTYFPAIPTHSLPLPTTLCPTPTTIFELVTSIPTPHPLLPRFKTKPSRLSPVPTE